MDKDTKFARMVDLLRSDRTAREKLLDDPDTLLADLGLDAKVLNDAYDQQALDRANALLKDAGITNQDDAVSALRKLGTAAKKHFANGHEVEIEPFGVKLLERVPGANTLEWTATGTIKCTFSPWDGCSPDPDW